jgi:hypothetical protein
MAMIVSGRLVDPMSLELDGIDIYDYPEFCEARYSYAEFWDGTALSEAELEDLYYKYPPDYSLIVNYTLR